MFKSETSALGDSVSMDRKMQSQQMSLGLEPSLFDSGDEVRPRKHGEQTVAIGRGRLIAGAGRVALIGRPAAVHGLPENTRRGGVSSVLCVHSEECSHSD